MTIDPEARFADQNVSAVETESAVTQKTISDHVPRPPTSCVNAARTNVSGAPGSTKSRSGHSPNSSCQPRTR